MQIHLSKVAKALLFILLMLISLYSFCFIENKTFSYLTAALAFLVLIIFIVYLFVRKNIRNNRDNRITHETHKVNARILAVKIQKAHAILQLLVEYPDKEYVSSLIVDNTEENGDRYKAGQKIPVFVDPKDRHHVIIPELHKTNAPRKNINWALLIYIPVLSASFVVPFIINLFDTSDRKFQDIECIQVTGNTEKIWEVRYKSPDKLFINIYDPLTCKKIKSIKDNLENEPESYTNFNLCLQDQKVYITGTGDRPVMDVYDALTFEKISDLATFEKSNTLFKQGISDIQSTTVYSQFVYEDVYAITTNDGNKCYYNIPDNMFYNTQEELTGYFLNVSHDMLMRQKFIFALSILPEGVDKHQLYLIKATDTSGVRSLLSLAGNNLNVEYFNSNKGYYYKYCELVPLCSDQYFLEGRIMYFDSSMVIIQHVTAINKDAGVILSGFDTKGNTLFTIKQEDYPNIKEMTEDDFSPRDYQKLNIVRYDNKVVILFGHYGGCCIDVETGKMLWKLEI
ncbi:MAG TPA: hypothetical protein PKN48_03035 [Bacteroidales bacterium]|nr:hypothetical protein [Bacteroidales bacterium]